MDVECQRNAVGQIQALLWDEVPAAYPYFYNFLGGHDESVENMQSTALGHTILSGASKTS